MGDEGDDWRVDEWADDPRFASAVKFVTVLGLVYIVVGVTAFFVLLTLGNPYLQAGEQVPHWASSPWVGLLVSGGGVVLSAGGVHEWLILRRGSGDAGDSNR
jgi:hypothetical protein